MAIKNAHVPVATTATEIASSSDDDLAAGKYGVSVAIKNGSDASVFLGDAAVTTGNGYELAAGAELGIDLERDEAIFGVVASGTKTVQVLRQGAAA